MTVEFRRWNSSHGLHRLDSIAAEALLVALQHENRVAKAQAVGCMSSIATVIYDSALQVCSHSGGTPHFEAQAADAKRFIQVPCIVSAHIVQSVWSYGNAWL